MADLAAGPWTEVSCALLAAAAGLYALLVALHAVRGLRLRLPDRWSAATASLLMGALAWVLWQWGPSQFPAPFSTSMVAIVALAAVGSAAFTGLGMQLWIDRQAARLPRWLRWRMPDMSHEDRRKGPHLLMGLFVLNFAVLGHVWLMLLGLAAPASATGEGWGNVVALRDGPWMHAGHVTAVWFALLLVFVLLPVELLRLRDPQRHYPFRRMIESRLRDREKGLFGAHLYIAIGVALAVLVLGRDPAQWETSVPAAMAMVAVTVFADTASALVGIRWGRTRWFHNPGKSYAGSLGGAVVAFAVCLPLVGPAAAGLASAVFVAIDATAPVPLPVSDNLLNPVALAALFLAVPGQGWLPLP